MAWAKYQTARALAPSVSPAYCLQKEHSGAEAHQEAQRCPWQVGHAEDYHLLVGL